MGSNQRFIKSKSFDFAAKSFAAIGFAVFIGLSACSSSQKSDLIKNEFIKDIGSLGTLLTGQGESENPVFSPYANMLYFVGEDRRSHKNPQAYAMDLLSFEERRVTFQDGQILDVVPVSAENIVYSSSTDELKERPKLFSNPSTESPYPGSELYLSDLYGGEIRRLTNEPGFDNLINLRLDRPQSVTFSKWRGTSLQLWQINWKTGDSIPLFKKKDTHTYGAEYSATTKEWLWIEQTAPDQLLIKHGAQFKESSELIPTLSGKIQDAHWVPGQRRLTYVYFHDDQWKPAFYDLEKKCGGQLFESGYDILQLRWSTDAANLALTAKVQQKKQIILRPSGAWDELSCK